jgi:hypothetical protein
MIPASSSSSAAAAAALATPPPCVLLPEWTGHADPVDLMELLMPPVSAAAEDTPPLPRANTLSGVSESTYRRCLAHTRGICRRLAVGLRVEIHALVLAHR